MPAACGCLAAIFIATSRLPSIAAKSPYWLSAPISSMLVSLKSPRPKALQLLRAASKMASPRARAFLSASMP